MSTPQGNLGRQSITTHTLSNNAAKDAVLNAIQDYVGDEGISLDNIYKSLQGNYYIVT